MSNKEVENPTPLQAETVSSFEVLRIDRNKRRTEVVRAMLSAASGEPVLSVGKHEVPFISGGGAIASNGAKLKFEPSHASLWPSDDEQIKLHTLPD